MSKKRILDRDWLLDYPNFLGRELSRLGHDCPEIYVTGGAVRDWLRGVRPGDLDLTIAGDGPAAARRIASEIGGAYILLDEAEGVARVVCGDLSLDISGFREGTTDILADLYRRDFSINALAIRVDPASGDLAQPREIIDPQGGVEDLGLALVRAPEAAVFERDPLRLLRAHRFAATLRMTVESRTRQWIRARAGLVTLPAPERLNHELELIMASPRAATTIGAMAEDGLLAEIFPELDRGRGMAQPASHHLDVLGHNLAALTTMEELLGDPGRYFPDSAAFTEYLALPGRLVLLKWAALFHDLGKPVTLAYKESGQATFYNHDRAGARLAETIARRLRWSRERSAIIARLIELHMYPFHLNNAMARTGITPRACLRLVKAAGNELPGLFLLALSDSLAAGGPLKPDGMEESLVRLYQRVEEVYRESVRPVLHGPKLLDGHDLIELGLQPGPLFGRILDGLEQARVAGTVLDRESALKWVAGFVEKLEPR